MEGFDIEEIKEELKTMSVDEKIEYLDGIIHELNTAKEELEDLREEINEENEQKEKTFYNSVFSAVRNHLTKKGIPAEKAAVEEDKNGDEYVRFYFQGKYYSLSLFKFQNDCFLHLKPDTFIASNEKRLQAVKPIMDAAGVKFTEEYDGYRIVTDTEHCTEHIINIISVE